MPTTNSSDKARFDTRLSQDQKLLFEKAAQLGGYRNLTDFVLATVQEKAVSIIEEQEQIIASKKDSELFFDAITNPSKPNTQLKKAVKHYNDLRAK